MHGMSSMILSFPKSVAVPQPGFPGPARIEIPGGEGRGSLARRRASVQTQIGFMRACGMSNTGIRRALGLSEREAVEAGIIPRLPARSRSGFTSAEAGRVEPTGEDGVSAPAMQSDDPSGRSSGRGGPLLAEVLAAVARAGNVGREEIVGASQGRRLTPLRQLTMLLLRELCDGASLPAIGHFLGRDHTTVHYGCRKAEERLRSDPGFRLLYETVRTSLAQHAESADG